MTDTSQRLASLSPQKRALLARLLQKKANQFNSFPLSYSQQRLWFLHQMESDSASYNIPAAVHLAGHLDVRALQSALDEIVRRHEVLRTIFLTLNGQPVQVVMPAHALNISTTDLTALTQTEREAETQRLAGLEAQRPFDLSAGPLLRVHLLRLAAQEHVVLLTMHHIISDGWSMNLLVQEISTLYTAFSQGAASPLPELTIQYADYAQWQRQHLSGAALDEQLQYWTSQLAGATTLELPTDRPRPAVQSYRGASLSQPLSPELAGQLQALSQREGATLFMTLLAAWQVLLMRYSGQTDISVGTPVAGRTRAEVEPLIGFFVNTLVLRTELAPEWSFKEALARVREVCLGAYAHQEVPFEMLVEQLQPERSLSHSPLFQVMFVLQNTAGQSLALPGLQLAALPLSATTAKFDLTLTLMQHDTELHAALEYNTDLFDEASVSALLAHYRTLLESIAADAARPLSNITLLSVQEEQRLLVEWNAAAQAPAPTQTIAGLFAAQAAQTPEAVALVFGAEQVTYRELNARANQLAHYLQARGVGPESLVGVMAERSVELIVALLGVVKAGGAYVPLDPAYPQERLSFMLADAGVALLLTQQHLVEVLPPHRAALILLDGDWPVISLESTENPLSTATAENLAYVMYTSGSTGQPKGVSIAQRGVVRLVRNPNYVELSPAEVLLQLAPVTFDASTFEVWGALLNGGRLVVMSAGAPSLEAVCRVIAEQGVTTLWLTAGLFHVMVDERREELGRVRQLLAGGDVLSVSHVRRMLARQGESSESQDSSESQESSENEESVGSRARKVINGYGPTENTTFTCCHVMRAEHEVGATVSIGRPIENTDVYVLDTEMRVVPVGVTGELYVGGAGLARDYLKRPEQTAERFVPHPYARTAGERLYRTGDVVRWLRDGTLEYIGRADYQVKIRGYRIELGEIEAVITAHGGVREAVVVAREEAQSGGKRLVGYCVAEAGAEVSGAELREHVRERLPEYMVPSVIVLLDEMPLTANGKIDRRALPVPEDVAGEREHEYVAARTPVEELLTSLWREVLGVPEVGVFDNFFTLGGHSLLATQLVSRIRDAFHVELPLRTLFEAPTLASLAGHIESGQRLEEERAPLAIKAMADNGELELSFAQQRLWFLAQLEPDTALYNISTAVRLSGPLDVGALEQSLNEIVRRHDALRTAFRSVNGRATQFIYSDLKLPLPLRDLRELPDIEKEAHKLLEAEAQQPFDLAACPLLRAVLLRLDEQEYILQLTMHHIISDGWSIAIIVREIAALYQAIATDTPSTLPEHTVQYFDYARWQRQRFSGAALEDQLNYWTSQLTGAATLELPTDRPRPAVQSYRGANINYALSSELSEQLKELSKREGATLFMTLLAAWQVLLMRYSGQTDISVGTPVAGRTRAEVEPLIGFFVNTLVLRTELAPEWSFTEALARVREVCLGGYAHQEVPFEMLVEQLQPERSLSHSPLFQVMLTLNTTPLEGVEFHDLDVERVDVHTGTAKFDLTLALVETEQELTAAMEYNTDLFDEKTINRMLLHYETLLTSIISDPQQRISEMRLLDAGEERQLIYGWNDTSEEYATTHLLHAQFHSQVERTPHAPALIFEDQHLSYAELNARANQLAHFLQARGVGPDVLVGVMTERSIEMVVALLAILKAGGAYLPLDPSYPQERLAYMLANADAPVLLTQSQLSGQLPTGDAEVVLLDTDWPEVSQFSTDNPLSPVGPDNLAYVIYTSGSTGQPKGVMVSHRGICNRLFWMQQAFALTTADCVMQKTPFSFDVSVWEFFWPLLVGARLVVARPDGHRDPAYLLDLIEREAVTTLHFVPSMLQVFVEAESVGARTQSLRQVMSSGEALPLELVRRYEERVGRHAQLHNLYGPTEASVDVTWWPAVGSAERVAIGKPIANIEMYVLDRELRVVPVGVAGELYIGGVGLARGYKGRAELTAERFVPHPYATEAGERVYRTGDIARWLSDGNIEYLGRADHQVKVRGFRIELGEIETVVMGHAGVREAVVVAREDAGGGKRLVCYCVLEGGSEVSSAEVREHVRERLPEYMVPAAVVLLAEMPLTANGKVNRKALPAPEEGSGEREQEYVAARTAVEELLASAWREVLGVEHVGIFDNFFEIGGDSILSIQVIAQAAQHGIRITPKQIFQYPTIAELAAVADTAQVIEAEQGLVTGNVPLTPVQQWFFEQPLDAPQHWNQAVLFEVKESLNLPAIEAALNHLVEHHDALRLRFKREDAGWQQSIAGVEETNLIFSYVDSAQLPDEAAFQSIASELQASLNLTEGPLARVAYFEGTPERAARLLMVFHHLLIDGVSWRILLEDMQTAYRQLSEGKKIRLPAKTTSYKSWSEKLSALARTTEFQEQQGYWLAAAASHVAQLPVCYMEGVNTVASARTIDRMLTADETQSLLQEVPAAYHTTVNDVLLTALALAFERWTEDASLQLDLEGHGREDILEDVDLTRTVGWFTSIYPVTLTLEDSTNPGEQLKSIKEQLRLIPHHGVGYGMLRHLSGNAEIADRLRKLPQSEVIFNYLGQFDQVISESLPLRPSSDSGGVAQSPGDRRRHLLDISGSVSGRQLRMMWTYSENVHTQAVIENLADDFMQELRALIAHCQSLDGGDYTPSDFPLANLDEQSLNKILDTVEF